MKNNMKSNKKLVDVKIHSGCGDISIYSVVDKRHLRMIKRDIKGRNRHLKKVGYPQRWSYEIL